MRLIDPLPVHPLGKAIRLTAEFKRTDGKPVRSHPDYPLGLAADIETPSGQRTPVKFPLERGRDGVFTGEPDIEDTTVPGEYRITLKVSGGGEYQSKHPVSVQVQPAPYLSVQQPKENVPVILLPAVDVQVQLLQAGKPLRPQEAFTNHPDQLVVAQVTRGSDGARGEAVWLDSVTEAGAIGLFAGKVPLPEPEEGGYTIAVKLAPEEEAKQAVADRAVVGFVVRQAPTSPWVRVAIWLLIGVPILAALVWWGRRRYVARLRFPFYYWVEDQATWRVIPFARADEARDLPEVPLRIRRVGREKKVRIEPATGAKLLTGGSREVPFLETDGNGRVLVRAADGTAKAVHFDCAKPPPRPDPYERSGADGGGTGEAPTSEEEFDWGFGKTTK